MNATEDRRIATVVIPAYNGARLLGHTLDSLAAQTVGPIDVIVVDDGSTDETVDVASAHPVVTRVIRQEHHGVAVARNRGLAVADTSWIGFVDQDDLWHRERLETLLLLAETTGALAVATTELPFAVVTDREALAAIGDGRDDWPQRWIAPGAEDDLFSSPEPFGSGEVSTISAGRLMQGAAMLTTAVLYDRETAIAAGGFAPHARALDDHVLNINLARITGPIPRVDSKQLLYRVHPESTSTVSPMVGPFLSMQAAMRLGGMPDMDAGIGPNVEHLLYNLHRSGLSARDQRALLELTVPYDQRWRWRMRWLARRWRIR
ncbi:MAG TPA: glycosyltransferase family A protein [Lacisediminihabitans sp.]|uniref:glycosyltransferase family A protein n=1 Tax=Lacisediminihabitans sp. TaxID=2787631 RepID=UPI002ED7E2C2